ncbi:linear amide C-N hydrolase [Edaphobacter sp. 12200R-103]|jgi:choloylglycine hydrolase|uniref:linear amide C-N hydrolase n=1 Tax=Edaphobacter sp. 12200R-103 TaxID=2703788 RepID=UPI00138B7D56|nr:linear amide C-N hydrolase [Edaphobacter sp. 12200R-103]QHS52737.1 linear amide C-N hydrolase [Edaphobacter sp. 12200R-103]
MLRHTGFFRTATFLASTLALILPQPVDACSRAVFLGDNGTVITGRTMDWKVDVGTNLWIFPRGIHHTGKANPRSLAWTSKYGSVIASGYEAATTDGMNEKGLVANALWLVESKYPDISSTTKPLLPLSIWAQYVLDNFATVQEAVSALEKEPFLVWTTKVPGEETLATLHFSISDPTGDSAIIEYIKGHQVIHHNRSYQVMTNSPIFEEQLALQQYWKQIGGTIFLPGTNRAADRFARASFYINTIPKSDTPDIEVASVFSVMRNVSVPYGINTPDEPNISSTRWRTVADQKRLIYCFESALTPNTFWVNLHDVDFSPTSGTRKLDLGPNQTHTFSGNVAKDFKEAKSFSFLGY